MASANKVMKLVLGVKDVVVEGVRIKESKAAFDSEPFRIVIDVRPCAKAGMRCQRCGRRCAGYDKDSKPKLWRSPDLNGIKTYLSYRRRRVLCPEHGVEYEAVPWAFPATSFTRHFTSLVALLSMRLNRTAAAEMLRVNWRTAQSCVTRILGHLEPDPRARLRGLASIGIDETSYTKGHNYVTTVVNHDTGEVVWAAAGHDEKTLSGFFEELTEEERASIRLVSGDAAAWIRKCVAKYCPGARFCLDGFHAVQWAVESVDDVRREEWNAIRAGVRELDAKLKSLPADAPDSERRRLQDSIGKARDEASRLKNTRYALGKNPENLTPFQQQKLEFAVEASPRLARAHRLKELARLVFHSGSGEEARAMFKDFYWKATHSRLAPFRKLAHSYKEHLEEIINTVESGLSNARIEAMNSKIKLMIRKAYGFQVIENLLSTIMLGCSNLRIPLPNRNGFGMRAC